MTGPAHSEGSGPAISHLLEDEKHQFTLLDVHLLKPEPPQRHLQGAGGHTYGDSLVPSAPQLQDSWQAGWPQPRDLCTCTQEGPEDPFTQVSQPSKESTSTSDSVPDPLSFPLPNSTGTGIKGAHSLAKSALFWAP